MFPQETLTPETLDQLELLIAIEAVSFTVNSLALLPTMSKCSTVGSVWCGMLTTLAFAKLLAS